MLKLFIGVKTIERWQVRPPLYSAGCKLLVATLLCVVHVHPTVTPADGTSDLHHTGLAVHANFSDFATPKQVWNLMPLDPVAWLVMYNEHQVALADLIAANMRHRLPLEAVRDVQPPQQLVGPC